MTHHNPRYNGHWTLVSEWNLFRALCLHCDVSYVAARGIVPRVIGSAIGKLRGPMYAHLEQCHNDRLGPQEPTP
jgi:hypothetical protein